MVSMGQLVVCKFNQGDKDMDNTFLKGLEQVGDKKINPELLAETILLLFHSIKKMEIKELITAKINSDLFFASNHQGLNERQGDILRQVSRALLAQAQALNKSAATGIEYEKSEVFLPLSSIFGAGFYEEKIFER